MSTIDFTVELAPNGQITVPSEVASLVPPGEQIQVIHWGVADDAWRAAGRRRFDAAYAVEDSVYELLADSDSTP